MKFIESVVDCRFLVFFWCVFHAKMKAAPFAANSRQSEVGAADDEQISRFVSEWGMGQYQTFLKLS